MLLLGPSLQRFVLTVLSALGLSAAGALLSSSCSIESGTLRQPQASGGGGGQAGEAGAASGDDGGQAGEAGAVSGDGTCAIDEVRCVSDDTYQRCGPDGIWESERDCPYLCRGVACLGICQPSAAECLTHRELSTCSEAGEWETKPCINACVDGRCTGVCTPGAPRCVNSDGQPASEGTASQVCDHQGAWSEPVDCLEGCSGGICHGRCEEDSEPLCVVEGDQQRAVQCSAGSWTTTDCSYVCDEGACTGNCKPGASKCDSDGAPATCDESGHWLAGSCAAGQSCVGDGSCLAPPVIDRFSADHAVPHPGEEVLLEWSLTGGTPETITIEPNVGRAIAPDELSVRFEPARSGEYTLRVSNRAGGAQRSLTLNLTPAGSLDTVHSFGARGSAVGLALSPSGRVLSACSAYETFTVGPVTATAGESYVAEHDLDEQSVLRMQVLFSVPVVYDLAADGEDVIAVGDSQPLINSTASSQIAVERLDNQFQTTDYVFYTVGAGTEQRGTTVLVRPKGKLWVASYASSRASSSLVELDSNLDPTLDGGEVKGHVNPINAYWWDLLAAPTGYIVGLRGGYVSQLDVLDQFPEVANQWSLTWEVPSVSIQPRAIASFSTGRLVVVGTGASRAYLQFLEPPTTVLHGSEVFYPSDLSAAGYDSVALDDVCINDASKVIVVGRVSRGGQNDVFVHAYYRYGDLLREEWSQPVIIGEPETNEWPAEIVCDPRGYALVLGMKQSDPDSNGGVPFIARIR